jgi:hypothetical protein
MSTTLLHRAGSKALLTDMYQWAIPRHGQPVREQPTLESIRERVQRQPAMLHPGIKRFENSHQYPAGLELGLHELKTRLILAAKKPSVNFKKEIQATDGHSL